MKKFPCRMLVVAAIVAAGILSEGAFALTEDEFPIQDFSPLPNGTYFVAETTATEQDVVVARDALAEQGVNPDTVYPGIASEVETTQTRCARCSDGTAISGQSVLWLDDAT